MSLFTKNKTEIQDPAENHMSCEETDMEITAVIIAAIEAYIGKPVSQLKYVAIRRATCLRNNWTASGTDEIISNRQQLLK